jgi:Tfp pilus assembly protein PilF
MDRIAKLTEFLTSSPNDNFVKHALALEYAKIGDDVRAQQLFEDILQHSPDYIGSYYHFAKLLERTQQRESAIAWYEKGMEAAKKAKDQHAYNELQMAYEDLTDD